MVNHTHCKRNRLPRDGGCSSPHFGRSPGATKKMLRKPADSSIPSDWYPEKSCAAAIIERKLTKQATTIPLGQTFSVSSTAPATPTQQSASSARGPLPSQRSVGAYQ